MDDLHTLYKRNGHDRELLNCLSTDNFKIHIAVQCEDIQQIPNGKVTKTGTSIGSTATFICDTGYNLRPRRKSITCTGDGWSDYIPICFGTDLIY